MTKKKILVLGGPTAVGKTALSIELAKRLNGEIISADSMQIYEYMDIGSAKITKEEMQNKEIRQLKEEAQKLANIASKTRTDNERLKYLISVLKINQSLKVAVEKNNGVK